jgi:cobalt/nickel transport system ATP-binding protein
MSYLKIVDLSFSYSNLNTLKILDNLSLEVSKGESVGIIGANGSGKTTLFNLISGLETPDSGYIEINNKPVIPNTFNKSVGYVFQNPDNQLFSLSVIEDICFAPMNIGVSKENAYKKALEILEDINLIHLKDRIPHHLSLGEKRMVSIASVLSFEPDIIIFDEPTSNLDSKAKRTLINYLNKMEVTKIISSHDLEFIIETCKTTSILYDGNIKAYNDTIEILSDEELMLGCDFEIPMFIKH